jgi:glycosyltransferase involved in cell wall biosynthesis
MDVHASIIYETVSIRYNANPVIRDILILAKCFLANTMSSQHSAKQTVVTFDKKSHFVYETRNAFSLTPLDGDLNLPTQLQTPDVTVIIPAYCEEETISEVIQRVINITWTLGNVEIIVVDDGSTDRTAEKIAAFPLVKHIRHEHNLGKGAALRTGIQNARGKILVIQDADLEYAPEFIPSLVEPIADGTVDIVYGSRFKGDPDGMSFSHFIGNSILSLVARFLYRTKITDIMTGQKAFRKSVLDAAKIGENGFAVEVEMTSLSLNGAQRFTEIPIPYVYRSHGTSKIGNMDGVRSLVKMFTTYLKAGV